MPFGRCYEQRTKVVNKSIELLRLRTFGHMKMTDVSKVQELRTKFLETYNGSILDDTYDDRDVQWVKNDHKFLGAVLNAFKIKGDVDKGIKLLDQILTWRAKTKINDRKETDLNSELRTRDAVKFLQGKDRNGHRILTLDVGKSKKGQLVQESTEYIAYYINSHYKQNPDQPIVLLFDFSNAGISNMDLDVTRFIVLCTNTYFPNVLVHSLMFKMGKALEAVWTVIKGWLDAEQSKKTYFVTRSNIQEYIEESSLPPHMIKVDKK